MLNEALLSAYLLIGLSLLVPSPEFRSAYLPKEMFLVQLATYSAFNVAMVGPTPILVVGALATVAELGLPWAFSPLPYRFNPELMGGPVGLR